ncbi:MAG: pentapeptide repeat-containing protein [SAR324 cluster bacterium]|jgi:uncharacterized protein YjbI with pentapeptide repeats|nr:pentapeptide repeat-containing protein [SAR324 cluster bacterium]
MKMFFITPITFLIVVSPILGFTPSDVDSLLKQVAKQKERIVCSRCDLSAAKLPDIDLSYADLRGANLSRANLRNADLRETDLREANLRDANLSYAILRGATFCNTILPNGEISDKDC